MNFLWKTLLKGLAAVLPVGITIYVIYWLATSAEAILRPLITSILPADWYWPGMGLVVGIGLLLAIGLAVNAWVIRCVFRWGDNLLENIPLVKSIYSTLRDFMRIFSSGNKQEDLQQVVLVKQGGGYTLGFLTEKHVDDIPGLPSSTHHVAVYIPMSYQVGGFTLYFPKDDIKPIDMSVEDAMRRVLTAGLSKSNGNSAKADKKTKSSPNARNS